MQVTKDISYRVKMLEMTLQEEQNMKNAYLKLSIMVDPGIGSEM